MLLVDLPQHSRVRRLLPADCSRARRTSSSVLYVSYIRAQICYELCVAEDTTYEYFGLQWSFECWCSASFDPAVEVSAPEEDCTTPCSLNVDEDCGGINRMFAYKINE